MECPLPVLYEEGPCLIVLKRAGLPTQAPPGIESVESLVKAWLKRRENKSGNVYLGVPHRLDRPVSGALVLARNRRAARRIAEQFEARMVKKTYWACVQECPQPAEGTWRDYVRKVPDEARAEIVEPDHPDGRAAVLHYKTLASGPWGSWLEIELETGRTHQIRVQAAARGCPVLGDELYGARMAFGPVRSDPRQRAIALHGRRLELFHPMKHTAISVTAGLPADWQSLPLPWKDGLADFS